jgi:hypothetical protein
MVKGYYVVAFYLGNFSCRFESENSTTIYMDREVGSYPTEEQARAAINLLEEGFNLGYEQAEYDCDRQEEYKN